MSHRASGQFWRCYDNLSPAIRRLADRSFAQVKADPRHPSLHFKSVGRFKSVRVGLHHRALGVEIDEGILWFWIGSHADYDKILGESR